MVPFCVLKGIRYEKNTLNQNDPLLPFLSLGLRDALFHGANPRNRLYALPLAPSDSALRLSLRMALGTGCGIGRAGVSFVSVWYAGHVSLCGVHGI